jgi:hypothetical protein
MKGKIYIIKPKGEFDEGERYIGSTSKKYLSQRWSNHCVKPKGSMIPLFEKYGRYNLVCELLEELDYENKIDLLKRERYYIESMPCVNIQIPSRGKVEYRRTYMSNEVNRERKTNLERIRRKNHTVEDKERRRLRHNELQRIRRNSKKQSLVEIL